VFGDCALVGDERWAGTYGVSGDYIARDNCRQNGVKGVFLGFGRLLNREHGTSQALSQSKRGVWWGSIRAHLVVSVVFPFLTGTVKNPDAADDWDEYLMCAYFLGMRIVTEVDSIVSIRIEDVKVRFDLIVLLVKRANFLLVKRANLPAVDRLAVKAECVYVRIAEKQA
jgi:hypothetical protein